MLRPGPERFQARPGKLLAPLFPDSIVMEYHEVTHNESNAKQDSELSGTQTRPRKQDPQDFEDGLRLQQPTHWITIGQGRCVYLGFLKSDLQRESTAAPCAGTVASGRPSVNRPDLV